MTPATPPAVSDKVASYYSNPPTAPAKRTPTDLASAMGLLADTGRPWTLSVIGDSTGNGADEWVYLLAEDMSGKYNRPVTVHNWSIETNTYVDATTVGEGAGSPIVVWNGSASGKNLDYSLTHRAALLPERPDLVVVNHGHNLANAHEAQTGSYKLVDWVVNAWDEAPAVAVTLQNPRVDKGSANQASVVSTLRQQWSGSTVTIVDAWAAFEGSGQDPATLLRQDGFHPSPAGEVVWAEAARKALLG